MVPFKFCFLNRTFHVWLCLFVFWGVNRPTRYFLRRRHHYQWRAATFDLCSAFTAIEQWPFFCMPHLLWHRTSNYDSQFRGRAYYLAFSSGAVTTFFNGLGLSHQGFEHPTFCLRGERSNPPRLGCIRLSRMNLIKS